MKKLLTVCAGVLVALLVFVGFRFQNFSNKSVGSVPEGQAYYSTSTDTSWNVAVITSNFKLLKNGPGVLGSVIITKSVAGALNLYDGTTTSAHSNVASTTLANIAASVAAGTYTFDSTFNYGLIAEFPTALGAASSTITWR